MIELLSTEQMAKADALTISGDTPSLTLMENAGRGVAEAATHNFPSANRFAILCGPGNNGGDGFVAARYLKLAGAHVSLFLLGDKDQLAPDASHMAAEWNGEIRQYEPGCLEDCDIIIDALFGSGLTRSVDGLFADAITEANDSNIPILAVDIPSGIDGTTGKVKGTAIRAAITVTFFRRKLGHLLLPGKDHCGALQVVDIGICEDVLQMLDITTFANEAALWLDEFPKRSASDHKYDRGHALVISGNAWSTGAARLAARGALRVGAGLVTIASPVDALAVNAAHLTAIMLTPFEAPETLGELLADRRMNACLIGPGVGVNPQTRLAVLEILRSDADVVLDADALTAFEHDPETLFEAINRRAATTVMTPHEGEFDRIFPQLMHHSGAKIPSARTAARKSGTILVLKGSDTVIASPDGKAAINVTAPSCLATAGSGDVLAGMVTGLLAQKMPAFEACAASVWLHSRCAMSFGPGLIAEDLPERLPDILANLADC